MSSKKKTNIIIALIILATLAVTLFVYPSLPQTVPTHWGVSGQIDGMGPKYTVFIGVAVALFINILMLYAEKLEPKKGSYAKFDKVFNIFRVFITLLMCGLQFLTIAYSFDSQFADMNKIMYIAIGFMFILLGNYMPKVKHNYTFGIKTPWTYASERVWNKTHRMAGPVWVVGGIVIAAGAFIKNRNTARILMLVIMIVLVIIPMAYSYFEFKKEEENEKN